MSPHADARGPVHASTQPPGADEGAPMTARAPASRPQAPNILFVLTDDQGPWALGRESPELVTPTLDRRAAAGTYLERLFCASPGTSGERREGGRASCRARGGQRGGSARAQAG